MATTTSIRFHEVASLFPMMDGDDFESLKEDIRANGLREPIWTHEGKVIDGRNRLLACQDLGVEPETREWDGEGDLLAFVVSLNLHRRHLDEGQRAMIAARLATRPRGRPSENGPIGRLSRAQAADLLSTSVKSTQRAHHVQQNGVPELADAVDQAKVSLGAAAVIADLPEPEQAEVVAKGPEAVKAKAKEIREERNGHATSPPIDLYDDATEQAVVEATRPEANGHVPLPGQASFLPDADEADVEAAQEIKAENFEKRVNQVRSHAGTLKNIAKYDREIFRWSPRQKKRLAHSYRCIRDNLTHAIKYLEGKG